MKNLNINAARLWDGLMETAKIGGTPKGGICRLTLTDLDRQVRDWFKVKAESLGCVVTVDDMGAMFARRPGQRQNIPPIAMGSHLDTQPTGGKFDGVLGVLGALEALQTLHEAGYETYAPIEVINWTNEEGSRFTPAMVSSAVFSGAFDKEWVSSRQDRQGISFRDALTTIGYRGTDQCGVNHPLSGFFELHIEQGPKLEIAGKDIGIVTGVQGIRWLEAVITGDDRHAGTTPMSARKDAILVAARIIECVNAIALKHQPLAVGTVGLIEAKPNSPNVVAGEVFVTVDLRHPDEGILETMEQSFIAEAAKIGKAAGVNIVVKNILKQAPVKFNKDCVAAVRTAISQAGFSAQEIVSGAGHDAAYVSRVAPTTMIFIPCRDGISHNETEYSSKEQCAAGAQILLQSVLIFDRQLADRYASGKL